MVPRPDVPVLTQLDGHPRSVGRVAGGLSPRRPAATATSPGGATFARGRRQGLYWSWRSRGSLPCARHPAGAEPPAPRTAWREVRRNLAGHHGASAGTRSGAVHAPGHRVLRHRLRAARGVIRSWWSARAVTGDRRGLAHPARGRWHVRRPAPRSAGAAGGRMRRSTLVFDVVGSAMVGCGPSSSPWRGAHPSRCWSCLSSSSGPTARARRSALTMRGPSTRWSARAAPAAWSTSAALFASLLTILAVGACLTC